MEQELLTIPKHLTHPGFCRVRVTPAVVFSVVLCVLCLSFLSFCWPCSCLSSDYIFCLSLWYLRIPFTMLQEIIQGKSSYFLIPANSLKFSKLNGYAVYLLIGSILCKKQPR